MQVYDYSSDTKGVKLDSEDDPSEVNGHTTEHRPIL